MAIILHREAGLSVLRSELLAPLPHGFSTRPGGVSPAPWDSLNLGPSRGDDPENVRENYRRFCAVLGTDPAKAVLSQQTHTTNLRRVTAADAGMGLTRPRDYRDVDALMTDVPGLALTVFSPTAASSSSTTPFTPPSPPSTPDGGAAPGAFWRRPSGP